MHAARFSYVCCVRAASLCVSRWQLTRSHISAAATGATATASTLSPVSDGRALAPISAADVETHFRQGHAVGYAAGFKAGQLQEQALQVALTQKFVGTSPLPPPIAPLPHASGPSLAQVAPNTVPTQGEDAAVGPLPAAVVPEQAGLPRSGAAAACSAPGAAITAAASNGTSPQAPQRPNL